MAVIGSSYYNRYYGTKLLGTDDADSIYGFGGNDIVYAAKGADYVSGGSGDDQLYAGKEGS